MLVPDLQVSSTIRNAIVSLLFCVTNVVGSQNEYVEEIKSKYTSTEMRMYYQAEGKPSLIDDVVLTSEVVAAFANQRTEVLQAIADGIVPRTTCTLACVCLCRCVLLMIEFV